MKGKGGRVGGKGKGVLTRGSTGNAVPTRLTSTHVQQPVFGEISSKANFKLKYYVF